jgi:hypothetical protein
LFATLYKSDRVYTNLLKTTNAEMPFLRTNKTYGMGSLLGWVTFTNDSPTGQVSWIKTGWTNGLYPSGFTNESTVIGGRYLAPPRGTAALTVTNGTVTLTDGNLTSEITRNFTLAHNQVIKVTPTNNLVKLTLTAKTGLLARIFHTGFEQRSGGGVRRLDSIKPNETATHRFFCNRL